MYPGTPFRAAGLLFSGIFSGKMWPTRAPERSSGVHNRTKIMTLARTGLEAHRHDRSRTRQREHPPLRIDLL